MTEKTLEQELAGVHFARIDKALEGLIKACTKRAPEMEVGQHQAVIDHLQGVTSATLVKLQLAFQGGASFSFARPSGPVGMAPAIHIHAGPPMGATGPSSLGPVRPRLPGFAGTRAPLGPREAVAEAPRPIGRIARNSEDPDAGQVVVGSPIKALRQPGPIGLEGTGFLGGDDDTEIQSV